MFTRINSLGKKIHLSNGVIICRAGKQTKTALTIDIEVKVSPRSETLVSILNVAAQNSISEEVLKVCDGLTPRNGSSSTPPNLRKILSPTLVS